MSREPTQEIFLRDMQEHKMTVLHESGIYRHIRFRQPNNGNMWFDLTTWPGMLTISGDMGCWTFSRVDDMFTFFRGRELKINPSYWAEKLQHGTHGGSDAGKVWDAESFKASLIDHLDNYCLAEEDHAVVLQELKDGFSSEDSKYYLIPSALDFSCDLPSGGKFEFESCEMPDGMVYAYHFIWCLYAIVWGIQQWDATAQGAMAVATQQAE